MISSIIDLVYELPHKLLNNLRLGFLGKYENFGKSQTWVQTVLMPRLLKKNSPISESLIITKDEAGKVKLFRQL